MNEDMLQKQDAEKFFDGYSDWNMKTFYVNWFYCFRNGALNI